MVFLSKNVPGPEDRRPAAGKSPKRFSQSCLRAVIEHRSAGRVLMQDFSRAPFQGVGYEPTCGIEPQMNQPCAGRLRRTAGTAAGLIQIQKLKCGRKLLPTAALWLYLRCIQRCTSAPSLFVNAVVRNWSTCSFSTRPNCRSTDTPMSRPANSLTGRNSLMTSSARA